MKTKEYLAKVDEFLDSDPVLGEKFNAYLSAMKRIKFDMSLTMPMILEINGEKTFGVGVRLPDGTTQLVATVPVHNLPITNLITQEVGTTVRTVHERHEDPASDAAELFGYSAAGPVLDA